MKRLSLGAEGGLRKDDGTNVEENVQYVLEVLGALPERGDNILYRCEIY